MDTCDPVVMKAIKNVASRKTAKLWWEYLLHERTQAIYDEIRRLDGVRLKKMGASLGKGPSSHAMRWHELTGVTLGGGRLGTSPIGTLPNRYSPHSSATSR